LDNLFEKIPKAELHLHIEGSFEPELMFEIAQRNGVKIKYNSVEEVQNAYNFNNLQEFLDIYYAGANALLKEKDFYELTWAYLEKAHNQNVVHAEIMFDPQTHTSRGVPFKYVIGGIHSAMEEAEQKFGMTSNLVLSFLRHLSQEDAFKTLEEALPYKHWITTVGLDSSEVGNPPSKFKDIFAKAREEGFRLTAHAGEEGPAEYVWEALNLLNVDRIDHGNRSLEDEKLVETLAEEKIALTVCPLSNKKLQVVTDMKKHPLKFMLEKNLFVTVNSDDPAYFGGYVNDNYKAVVDNLELSNADVIKLARNSIEASFIDDDTKLEYLKRIDDAVL
jgi:adenosine deaminase